MQKQKLDTNIHVEKGSRKKLQRFSMDSTDYAVDSANNRLQISNFNSETTPIGNGIELPPKSLNLYKVENGKLVGNYYDNNLDVHAASEWTKNIQKAANHNYFA